MRRIWSVAATALLLASSAAARNTNLVLPIEGATKSAVGQEKLFDVPFYFHGQSHPKVKREISVDRVSRSSRGAFRSDESSCHVAFLSSLRELQAQAQDRGADAIIDIKSITKRQPLESATEYRCIAGAMVVHVGLEGTLVELDE